MALMSGAGFAGKRALPAIGSIATESATTKANMVCANRMGIVCNAISNFARIGVK